MTFVGSPCKWTGLGDFSTGLTRYQAWSLHEEHIATGITPNNNFLSDLKACLPGIMLEEDYQGMSDRTLLKNGKI